MMMMRRRRRRITIPMFLCCFDTHFDTDDWHCLQLCVKRPFNSSPVVLRPSLGKPKRRGNSPGFSGSCGIYLWMICVSNEALLRLSIIVDEGQHKEMPKDPDSQLLGWRWISLSSCGFQMFGKVGGTDTFAGNSWKFYPACDVARNTWCRLQLRHNCLWPPSMNLESLTRPTLTRQNLKRWEA